MQKYILLINGCGVWRSWLAYLHGVQVVVSSSLTTPTKKGAERRLFCFLNNPNSCWLVYQGCGRGGCWFGKDHPVRKGS